MRAKTGLITKILTQADTFPYSIGSEPKYNYLAAINTGTAMTITLTFQNETTLTIPMPANSTYRAEFNNFYKIDVATGTAFAIELGR